MPSMVSSTTDKINAAKIDCFARRQEIQKHRRSLPIAAGYDASGPDGEAGPSDENVRPKLMTSPVWANYEV